MRLPESIKTTSMHYKCLVSAEMKQKEECDHCYINPPVICTHICKQTGRQKFWEFIFVSSMCAKIKASEINYASTV